MTTKTGKKSAWKKDDLLTAYLVLLPSFLLLVTFVIAPLVISVVNSFYDSSAYMDAIWKGMGNYTKVLADEKFWKSIGVGLKFILAIVPIQLILAFFIAHLVIQLPKHLSSFVKVTVYMPCLLSGIIVGAIFSYIYASDAGGFLNNLLSKFGISPIGWTGEPRWALFSVAVAAIWNGLGYTTLVMLGGILDIPRDYYEAAKLDGAGFFAQMVHITIPSMRNLGVYLLISSFVSTFQLFELPFVLTGGGPLDMTQGPVGYLYYHFTWDDTLGMTYAGSVLVAIVLTSISSVVFRVVNSEKSLD